MRDELIPQIYTPLKQTGNYLSLEKNMNWKSFFFVERKGEEGTLTNRER